MGTKTTMLITVGTSLLDVLKGKCIDKHGRFIDSHNKPLKGAGALHVIGSLYNSFFGDLKQQLDRWEPNISVTFPSAEIQSFCFWLAANPKKSVTLSHIILMPTETHEAKACANKIREILLNQVLKSGFVQPYLPTGENVVIPSPEPFLLRIEDTRSFSEDIARFLKKLNDIMEHLRIAGAERFVFNITGGYKGLTPFFSLIGFLEEDIEVIYQHEEAKVVLRVPALPLAWDLKLFDEYRCLLRAEEKSPMTTPPGKFQILFDKRNSEWSKNPFGGLLEEVYVRDRLKRFGYGARLVRRLPGTFQEELENRIPRWENIWIGDQIPETVEHSRGHSQRVMEYAASLLEPLFAKKEDFLTDRELYCLVCCLWLHDIGHTALEFQLPDNKVVPVASFPTLVRNFHHFLSYQRILEQDYLSSDEKEVVALISKYDRRKMPLRTGDDDWRDEDFGLVAEALQKTIPDDGLAFKGETIPKDRLIFLCALLRMIDALDVQSDRVIDDNYWKERRQRTKEEVDHYRSLLSKWLELLDLCPDDFRRDFCCLNSETENVYTRWLESLSDSSDWDKSDEIKSKLENEIEPELVRYVREAIYLNDDKLLDRELLLRTLSLLDRVVFKMLQEAHFRKHSRVKLVYLTHRQEASNDFTIYRIQAIFDSGIPITESNKENIAKDIWKEIDKVKDTLEQEGIIVEGVFEGEQPLLTVEGGK